MATIAQAKAAIRGARGYTATHPLPWVSDNARAAVLAAQDACGRLSQQLDTESPAADNNTLLSPKGERLYEGVLRTTQRALARMQGDYAS